MKLAVLVSVCAIILSFSQEQPILEIEISNVRNHNGTVLISVCARPEEYPYHPFRTYEVSKDSLCDGKLIKVIGDLQPGTYAIALLDDENRSGEMEYNRLGIPLEGFAFANNVKPFLSRPDYDRCLFTIKPGINRMHLIVRYKN
ncbi:MAG: DUF2141 domain-containing protein [Bacteroidota bacterium]